MKISLVIVIAYLVGASILDSRIRYDQGMPHEYRYPILSVDRIVDGDTLDVTFALGVYGLKMERRRVRLLGGDAWEKRGETKQKGIAAHVFVRHWLEGGNRTLATFGDVDAFGRILGNIEDEFGNRLIDALRRNGHTTGKWEANQ